jgi:prepilin-type N-terminal cleavage/methylation domain-containing protein
VNLYRRAFTLIELLVVVAMMSLLAAVLVPAFLKAGERSKRLQRPEQAKVRVEEAEFPELKDPPQLLQLHSQLNLVGWTPCFGMDVTQRYRLRYQGRLVFAAQGGRQFFLPFPRRTEEASNVKVRLKPVGGDWSVHEWSVNRSGLLVALPPGQLEAEVSFEAQGRDRLWLELPPASRLGSLKLDLEAPQSGAQLAESSLQPQSQQPGHWHWEVQNLVSDSPILVELPGSHSLTGRVLALCRLAVLLFGLGFWYLGDLYRGGCLFKFGWGHFFLLALTYSSFFPALTVLSLGRGLALPHALGLATALTLPLLWLHVWRSVDARFAGLYVMPLAALTLGVVVNGVFGETQRELIFLIVALTAVALVTLTYPRWAKNRQEWFQSLVEQLRSRCQPLFGHGTQGQMLSRWVASLDGDSRNWSTYWSSLELAKTLEQEVHSEQLRPAKPVPKNELHCLRCGKSGPQSSYCGHCGNRHCRVLDCACGTRTHLGQLPEGDIYCPACGSKGTS